ncbi:hypothetical protein BDZ90DRAFT_218538 [Jaminaea rosea]|uniref:ARM repeat-containing protein n=1 Tax=Jaminaea rosea TaxID=1569628 RepID=A0A316UU63_9BASI|nr:hypothetical protein BDZ90DRAFT_218538 [Jaminaea rosea]PWN28534.1 hypothetical protein BDZ90DRAFT_218538 [Jaminaea rosea]
MVRKHAKRLQSTVDPRLLARGQSTDALLKKLKTIQVELTQADQDVDLKSLEDLTPQLVSDQMMLHKDQAVRASVACCLAEVLRLYAPNAPFTSDKIKDIFQFFLLELTAPKSGLSNPSTPRFPDYLALLDNLSRVKSCTLIADAPDPEELMTMWYKKIFDMMRPDMSKNIELSLADILAQLVDECRQIPGEVLDILLATFSSKAAKLNPAAHRLAVQICLATSDRLQSNVAQYFSENIVAVSSEEEPEERERELRSYHNLIVQVNRYCPALLLGVIAVLEQELTAEDIIVRSIAVHALGTMFGDKQSSTLATRYPSAWKAWLGRSVDKQPALRVLWVELTSNILTNHPQLRIDVSKALTSKVVDPDEKVRAAVLRVIGGLDYETALHHLDRAFLRTVSDRLRDRRSAVRAEAREALGRLYSLAYPEIENHDPAATKHFAWIPNTMLVSSWTDSKATLPLIATFEKHVLPLPTRAEDEAAWVNRLLLVGKHLDEIGSKALFLRLNNMVVPHARKPYLPFIEACEKYNGGVVDSSEESRVKDILKYSIRGIVTLFPDSDKAAQDLAAFAKLNDSRIYRLIKASIDPSTDLKTYIKARAEAIRRIEASDDKLLATMTDFIRIASYPFLNRSSIPTLAKRLTKDKRQWRESQIGPDTQHGNDLTDAEAFSVVAKSCFTFITKLAPQMYVPHLSDMIRYLDDGASSPELIEVTLKALASIKLAGMQVTLDKKDIDRVSYFTRNGKELQAKYAARLLAVVAASSCKEPNAAAERKVEELLAELSDRLEKDSPERLVADFSALGQLFKYAPRASENVWDRVVRDVLRELSKTWDAEAAKARSSSKKGDTASEQADEDEPHSWLEDRDVDDVVRAKELGFDVLCKRTIAALREDSDDRSQVSDMTTPVFRLLSKTMAEGQPRELNMPAGVKSRLRLKAGLSVLKMALMPVCDAKVGQHDLNQLAGLVQDACFNVRSRFLHKLLLYLANQGKARKLPTRYNAIPFLVAMDPEDENREMVSTWALRSKALPEAERVKRIEVTLCRYVHLLSHHEDFKADDEESIIEFVPYLTFYIDYVATEQNVGLLYYLAGRLKTVRDEDTQKSESLYTLSEMMQLIIKHKSQRHGWRLEQPESKHFRVPADTGLRAFPSAEDQKRVAGKLFLPHGVASKIEEELSRMDRKSRSGFKAEGDGAAVKRKRTTKRKPGQRVVLDDDDDDVEGEDDEEAGNEADEDEEQVSSDEPVSDGEEEGRGARRKAQARERNRKRAIRRETLAARKSAAEDEDEAPKATKASSKKVAKKGSSKKTAKKTATLAGNSANDDGDDGGEDGDSSMSELSDE